MRRRFTAVLVLHRFDSGHARLQLREPCFDLD